MTASPARQSLTSLTCSVAPIQNYALPGVDASHQDFFLRPLIRNLSLVPIPSSAMTSDGFELAALKSWQEAFEYPLGTTRQIEHALRAGIANNRDRLRTLVGYIVLTSWCRMLTLMSRSQGKLPRSVEHCGTDHISRWIDTRNGGFDVNIESQLQLGCYRKMR